LKLAQFKEVFSTTAKVILALFLISLGIGIVLGLVNLAGSSPASSSKSDWEAEYMTKQADGKKSSMPLSKWNRTIEAAIKYHCPAEGMTKEEVEKTIGKPAETTDSTWTYRRSVQKECLRYDGDNCAEYAHKDETEYFDFTPAGHLKARMQTTYGDDGWLYMNCFSEPFYSRYFVGW
jgi:hypothetical protein